METCHVRGVAGVRHAPRYEPIGSRNRTPARLDAKMREPGMERLVGTEPFVLAEASKAELELVAKRESVD
jgi:hypothetical protein